MRRLLAALLLVTALTACGKSTEEKYKEQFPPINRSLVALGDDVGEGLRSAGQSEDRALAGEFGAYARRLGELRGRLDGLEPPDRIETNHQRALTAMAAVRVVLSDVADAAKRSDAVAARDAATRLVHDGAQLDEARAELARAVRGL